MNLLWVHIDSVIVFHLYACDTYFIFIARQWSTYVLIIHGYANIDDYITTCGIKILKNVTA